MEQMFFRKKWDCLKCGMLRKCLSRSNFSAAIHTRFCLHNVLFLVLSNPLLLVGLNGV